MGCRRSESWKRLTFSRNVAVFILDGCSRVGQLLFILCVPIGCFLLNPPVIGWFRNLLEPSGACRCLGFHPLIVSSCYVCTFPVVIISWSYFDLYLILANCLVTSADVGWRFHRGDLRLVSQDNSFQSSQLTNIQFWLVVIFYLWSGCVGFQVILASLFSVYRWGVTGKLACNTAKNRGLTRVQFFQKEERVAHTAVISIILSLTDYL